MYSNQLDALGRNSVHGFIGVFPVDQLPKHIGEPPKSLIVNTDPQNLPGRHWIAVSYEQGATYAFDPVGFYYPQPLMDHLHSDPNRRVIYNYVTYQRPWERNCGEYCVSFLKSRSPKV